MVVFVVNFSAGTSGGLLKHENTVVHVDPNAPTAVAAKSPIIATPNAPSPAPPVNSNNIATIPPPNQPIPTVLSPVTNDMNFLNHQIVATAAHLQQQRGHPPAPILTNISGEPRQEMSNKMSLKKQTKLFKSQIFERFFFFRLFFWAAFPPKIGSMV